MVYVCACMSVIFIICNVHACSCMSVGLYVVYRTCLCMHESVTMCMCAPVCIYQHVYICLPVSTQAYIKEESWSEGKTCLQPLERTQSCMPPTSPSSLNLNISAPAGLHIQDCEVQGSCLGDGELAWDLRVQRHICFLLGDPAG